MSVTISDALGIGKKALVSYVEADLDTKVLLCHVLNCDQTFLYTHPEKRLTQEQYKLYQNLINSRLQGKPIAHITGHRGFWSLDLDVDSSTLIPRPDTELLVEIALSFLHSPSANVIDLGTGTGAIALSIAKELPQLEMMATDFSAQAIKLAKHNALKNRLNHVQFVQTSWLSCFQPRQFDLIISNPPYIRKDDPHLVEGDLRFEPLSALVAEEAGLGDIKTIVEQAQICLKSEGRLIIEHGYDQGQQVVDIFKHAGMVEICLHQDFGGNDRAVSGQLRL